MGIREKLVKYKFHILLAVTFSSVVLFHCYLEPSYLDVLHYFQPLLVSTALFLGAVVVLGFVSPLSPEASDSGEGFLEYVAGQSPTGNVHSFAPQVVEESVEAE